MFRLLLAHQPRSASAALQAGFDLQLSGHTHGGQFWPWNHFVKWQQPFTAGLHKLQSLWVYTSRGTGYWGPPKRFAHPRRLPFCDWFGLEWHPNLGVINCQPADRMHPHGFSLNVLLSVLSFF
jgi:hypothetical protein